MPRLRPLLMLLFALAAAAANAGAQSLSGEVTDDQATPLINVNVSIPALQAGTVTDAAGRYLIRNLSPGEYTVEFFILGYERISKTFEMPAHDTVLNAALRESPLELPAVTVTAKPQPSDILNSAQPVATLEDRQLDRERSQSISQSMENLAGVSMISAGPLNTKPVIRGLSAQRVVVVENGVRHESEQWDDVQSPEIDGLDVERVEVVRGPNSVLFGSDALGGVVNVITDELDVPREDLLPLAGEFRLNAFSGNRQFAGGLSLFGTSGVFSYKSQLSVRRAGDISTPGGTLFNSAANELNGKSSLGVRGNWGSVALAYSHFNQQLQVHPDPAEVPREDPFQNIAHDKVHLSANLLLAPVRLEVHGTWQRNGGPEFVAGGQTWTEGPVPDEAIVVTTSALDVKAHHHLSASVFGTLGASFMDQRIVSSGLEPLFPSHNNFNAGVFLYEEVLLSQVSLSAGLRYDARRLRIDEEPLLQIPAHTREYDALTGTAGVVWHATAPLSFAVNLGRGWRAPIVEELMGNGYEPGSIRYKVGNPDLNPEAAFNVDLVSRYFSPRLRVELTFFHNRINRYIYLGKTNQIDSASGLTKYEERQTNATLIGSELDAELGVTDRLVLHLGSDLTVGRNEETRDWLPQIPAPRVKTGLRLLEPSLFFLNAAYVSLSSRIVFDQNRVDTFEEPTPGYTLFDAGFGGELATGGRPVGIDLSVENLFNRSYRDHLSRYREYALNPGINVTLRLSIPFTLLE